MPSRPILAWFICPECAVNRCCVWPEAAFEGGSLFDEQNLRILTAVEDGAGMARFYDVMWITLSNGSIDMVINLMPASLRTADGSAGLQSAVEAKGTRARRRRAASSASDHGAEHDPNVLERIW